MDTRDVGTRDVGTGGAGEVGGQRKPIHGGFKTSGSVSFPLAIRLSHRRHGLFSLAIEPTSKTFFSQIELLKCPFHLVVEVAK